MTVAVPSLVRPEQATCGAGLNRIPAEPAVRICAPGCVFTAAAALDAFSRSIGPEVINDGVHITTVYMPLVRTPMIAPTKIYDRFPTLSPEEAGHMIADAIRKPGAPETPKAADRAQL